jgi:hypothetical protein
MRIDDEDDEKSFEVSLDLFTQPAPWYKRLWWWVWRREPPQTEVSDMVIAAMDWAQDEFNKRTAVADCVEAGLASSVWASRLYDEEIPGATRYYVVSVAVRDHDKGFWLYVEIQATDSVRKVFLPLHEFLEQCWPVDDLTFVDYDA